MSVDVTFRYAVGEFVAERSYTEYSSGNTLVAYVVRPCDHSTHTWYAAEADLLPFADAVRYRGNVPGGG